MTSSFKVGTTTITPNVVDGYSSARPARNVVHAILGTTSPAFTLRKAGLRTGTLTAVFASESDAHALETMLSGDAVVTFADTDTATGMRFAATNTVDLRQDDTRAAWLVSFGYQEVPA